MTTVDLRSDTCTKPTGGMRRAMVDAEVGNDVYGEDPTVDALERRVAERLDKEAAVMVTSGTQGNSRADEGATHRPGDSVRPSRLEFSGTATRDVGVSG